MGLSDMTYAEASAQQQQQQSAGAVRVYPNGPNQPPSSVSH